MTLQPAAKRSLVIGTFLLALAVLVGAFGAHGLKSIVGAARLVTFETGVRYQFYHAFGLVIVGFFVHLFPSSKMNIPFYSFLVGILLFSFNCYLYVITGIKVFAIVVPLGGLLFVIGWLVFCWNVLKLR